MTAFVRQSREYQQWARDAFFRYFETKTGNPVIAMPTGTGKSVVIADICIGIVIEWHGQRILILAPTKELVSQNAAKFLAMAPQIPVGICSASLNKYQLGLPLTIGTIGTVYNRRRSLGRIDLVFIDECHLVSHKEETQYRQLAEWIMVGEAVEKEDGTIEDVANPDANPNCKFIGLSATPYRLGLGHITDGGLFTDVCFDACGLDAFNWFIAQGYLVPLIPRPTRTVLDTTGVKKSGGDYVGGDLQRKVNKAEITAAAVAEALELSAGRNKVLWFATGIEHAEAIRAELESHGEQAVAVHSKSATRDDDLGAFMTFGANGVRHCVNFGVLTTGFDFDALDCIAMLRPTQSPGLWCLDKETEILTPAGFRRWNEIAIGDTCLAFDEKTGEITQQPITGYVERALDADERMLSLQGRRHDLRVSDRHQMLATTKYRRLRRHDGTWHRYEARQMAMLCDVSYPVSGLRDVPDIALSDDELRFVGWWLADGTHDKSNNTISIAVSHRYPALATELERVMDACDLGWRSYRLSASRKAFQSEHGITQYKISHDNLRGVRRGKKGWKHLDAYLDKDISPALAALSPRQFEHLLFGINAGDGAKYTAQSIDWAPRTFSLAMGKNKTYADAIQALAVQSGYRADLSDNGTGCLMLRVSPSRSKFFANTAQAAERMTLEPFNDERVWCIENPVGTLITRRNGKVTIMGNCQMIGRGTRTLYADGFDLSTQEGRLGAIAASIKQDCLVLDFAYNTAVLGPINDPKLPKKSKKTGGEPPVKTCGRTGDPPVSNIVEGTSNIDKGGDPKKGCGAWNHPSARHCVQCGAEFTFEVKFSHTAANTPLLRKSSADVDGAFEKPVLEEHKVSRVTYALHKKDGRPDSIRVDYYCGLRRFSHYVLPEHGGAPRRRSEEWWSRHGGGVMPATTGAARLMIDQLRTPKKIIVWIKKDYPQIMDWIFE